MKILMRALVFVFSLALGAALGIRLAQETPVEQVMPAISMRLRPTTCEVGQTFSGEEGRNFLCVAENMWAELPPPESGPEVKVEILAPAKHRRTTDRR